jgi:hypothetical protein
LSARQSTFQAAFAVRLLAGEKHRGIGPREGIDGGRESKEWKGRRSAVSHPRSS